jgi:hypothetical protein
VILPTGPVRAEIDSLIAGYRKGVVKPGITILKFDDASRRDHQQVRLKTSCRAADVVVRPIRV